MGNKPTTSLLQGVRSTAVQQPLPCDKFTEIVYFQKNNYSLYYNPGSSKFQFNAAPRLEFYH